MIQKIFFIFYIEDIENENSLAMIIFKKEINNEYFGISDSDFLFELEEEEEIVKGYLICKNRFSEKRNLTINYINVTFDSLINEINTFEEEDNIKVYNIKKRKKNQKIKKILLKKNYQINIYLYIILLYPFDMFKYFKLPNPLLLNNSFKFFILNFIFTKNTFTIKYLFIYFFKSIFKLI